MHSYCQTVLALQQKQVYCSKCDQHYNLYIYNQNQSLQSSLYKWVAILVVVVTLLFLFALLDAQLKANVYNERLANGQIEGIPSGEDAEPQGWQNFFEFQSLVIILACVVAIFIYFMYHLVRHLNKVGKRQMQVEVLSREPSLMISRLLAK